MEATPTDIKQIIYDICESGKPVQSADLAELSNLNAEQLRLFEQKFPPMDVSRRQKIVSLLVELAENNFELNYDDIFKILLRDKDPSIRIKAIEGLWENEDPPLIGMLIKLLNEDASEDVQAKAAAALGKFAILAELNKLRQSYAEKISESLISILNNKNKSVEVRRRALESAAPFSSPRIKKVIAEAYQSKDVEIRSSAVFAMGKSCDESWIPVLLKELNSPITEMRYEAAGACGEICDKEAVPQLINLTLDKDLEVQLAAIQALGKIGGAKSKQCLTRCIDSADDAICQAAEQALEQLESEEDISLF